MSRILEQVKGNPEQFSSSLFNVSLKLPPRHMAIVDAVMLLNKNKSEAIRFLIELGWETIENDGDFSNLVEHKEEALKYYLEKLEEAEEHRDL